MTSRTSLLCTSIFATDCDAAAKKASLALSSGSDLVEFRIDLLKNHDGRLLRYLSPLAGRAIFTVRPHREGGRYVGPEERRLRLIEELSDLNPAFVDVELSTMNSSSPPHLGGTKTIVSWHDQRGTPSKVRLARIASEALRLGDIAKVVTTAKRVEDNLVVCSLYDGDSSRTVAFCMGEVGFLSRAVSLERGSPIVYASLSGESVAAGQPPLGVAVALRRVLRND